MTEGRFRLAVVAIALGAALVYSPVLDAPYYFDDFSLQTDPLLQDDGGWLRLFDLERTRPLTYLSFTFTFRPSAPRLDHVVNLGLFLLLIACAAAVYRRLRGPAPALIATALLAFHPAASEAVAYVFARASVLAALLCVAAWLLWIEGRRWGAVAVFALALLAKEEAAGFALFLMAFEALYRRAGAATLRRSAGPWAAMVALVGAAFVKVWIAASVTPGAGAMGEAGGATPWSYFWTQGRALWSYLWRFVAPVGWNFDRDFALSAGPDAASLAGWTALTAGAAVCVRLTRSNREWFWAVGALLLFLPTSSVVPLADATADRRMLLPLLALAPGLSALLSGLMSGRRLLAAALALALPLAYLTHRRARVWSDAETLWRDTVARSPGKARPRLHLAQALAPKGGAAAAERESLLRKALSLEPDSPAAAQEWGLFLLTAGRPAEAVEPLRRASELDETAAQPLANLGAAYYMTGAADQAAEAFRQALERDPCSFDARNNLMLLSRAQGDDGAARALAVEAPRDCRWTTLQTAAMEAARGR